MRVISGTARGLGLLSPEGEDTRPTLDRVKEALFSMLTPYVGGAEALDLYAGSGALGIEALSRGAERAVFVEKARAAEAVLRANLQKARLEARAEVVRADAPGYLAACGRSFSLILLDPPYGGGLYEKTFDAILEKHILAPDGVMAVEWDAAVHEPVFPDGLERFRDRRYGRVHITLLRNRSIAE